MRFSGLIGLDAVKEHLQRAIRKDAVSHAYLFTGEAGMGKRTLAKTFAQALQCENRVEENGYLEPCGKCRACVQAQSDAHPDIRIIVPAKPTSIGVDDIREQIVNDAVLKPYAAPRKIYILPDAEKMTVEAQNALLKTLEEPPAYVVLILLTANESAFLPTVLSRLVTLSMHPVPDEALRHFLMETHGIPDYKAHLAVSFARGNVGRALRLATSDAFEARLKETVSLLSDIEGMRIDRMNARLQNVLSTELVMAPENESAEEKKRREKAERQTAIADFLEILLVLMRDVLVYKATQDGDYLIFAGELSYIRKAHDAMGYADVTGVMDDVFAAQRQLRANVNADLALELLLLKIQERTGST